MLIEDNSLHISQILPLTSFYKQRHSKTNLIIICLYGLVGFIDLILV